MRCGSGRAPEDGPLIAPADLHAVALPAGFELACVEIGPDDDRRACGQHAARAALAALGVDPDRLAYEGPRPIVRDPTAPTIAVSITHTGGVALAIAARVRRLGIDLCADDPRLPRLAERFLASERAVARTPGELAACFAAKEAALKALGVGLVDGGVLDGTAVRVVSLEPPRLSEPSLALVLARLPGAVLAVAYART